MVERGFSKGYRYEEGSREDSFERGFRLLESLVTKTVATLRSEGLTDFIDERGRVCPPAEGEETNSRRKITMTDLTERALREKLTEYSWTNRDPARLLEKAEARTKEKKEWSDAFEMAEFVAFNKFLGEHYWCLRTSEHDDIKNKADKLIIEKETNQVVAVLDDITTSEFRVRIALLQNMGIPGEKLNLATAMESKRGRREIPEFDHVPLRKEDGFSIFSGIRAPRLIFPFPYDTFFHAIQEAVNENSLEALFQEIILYFIISASQQLNKIAEIDDNRIQEIRIGIEDFRKRLQEIGRELGINEWIKKKGLEQINLGS